MDALQLIHPVRLRIIYAFAGERALTATQLQAWLAERLPRYMVPESFLLRDDLPKTSTGKIDRVSLKEQIQALQTQETPVR